MIKNLYYIFLIGFIIPYHSFGQQIETNKNTVLQGVIIGNDTIPHLEMREIRVYPKRVFKNQREYRQYTKLIYNVKKAYPFAILARTELRKVNDSLMHIGSDRERRKFLKEYEKDLFSEHEAELRKLTFTQGRIMLKLIDREIGNTSYYIIQQYRGNISAAFWQGIARLFGSNLKSEYDPDGEDAEIEMIVQLIEAGML